VRIVPADIPTTGLGTSAAHVPLVIEPSISSIVVWVRSPRFGVAPGSVVE
jgi:hypothetical protein